MVLRDSVVSRCNALNLIKVKSNQESKWYHNCDWTWFGAVWCEGCSWTALPSWFLWILNERAWFLVSRCNALNLIKVKSNQELKWYHNCDWTWFGAVWCERWSRTALPSWLLCSLNECAWFLVSHCNALNVIKVKFNQELMVSPLRVDVMWGLIDLVRNCSSKLIIVPSKWMCVVPRIVKFLFYHPWG